MADPQLGERTCAFVIPRDDTRPRLGILKAFLRDRGLAAFKLPDQLALVTSLPHTAVGKVDKNRLRSGTYNG
ncbi:hypothetical protein GCM10012275_34660 [Longimycelium tulufanense]|uniref:AMP-binding enzyme C-terminal domain-containing protein n=1 Tax=Longimycelium tulufanense TaxID=907463 RepID=A0A8J3CE12_9PSEU|nr:hypothetical protein [Longimycelium tulufanense]GGM60684.1 hypothetical protein GCM10012275_34660 [Longimycelium tulufanense]